MHIKVLGTKGEIEKSLPRHSKKSGVLIDGVLLLDIGEKEYLKYDPKWILITHLHPDHAYFMRKGHEESPATDALLFAPEPSKQGVGILRRKKKLGPYAITPIPTHHSVHVQSQAYLVQKGKTAILYTGDMVWPRNEQGIDLGGEKAFYVNAEYIIPIGGPLYGIFFYDLGNALAAGQPFRRDNLYTSTGFEARIFVPALRVPFRLIFAYNNRKIYIGQSNFAFRFAVGTTF